ncbi:beta-glucosidase family protein [Limosilactobacillus secaliphilus]|uniref:Beta-glucosidase-related glycosidase n=1 Tax=Limosilactobacillus secaliphilus TaxID=396268 RepID=A0A0R2ID11_9LACO|nr:glycoside hydrolase family 3 N-terminal domain-containing protein [Limosilactobacillus secaliphilus]KRN59469.1 beta-glucosidase-related glycosidase [Limosilactobacillus secaliphilus]
MKIDQKIRMQSDQRARQIVSKLSLAEKVELMSGKMTFKEVRGAIKKQTGEHYNQFPYPAGGNVKAGIPAMRFADGPRGVVCGINHSTAFPVSMARGATFNPRLEEQVGAAMGAEVAAYGGNLSAAVCMNLLYHPGWGRAQETYGEDTNLIGTMASALVNGIQSQGVIACLKHFAFNQMENARFKVNITADKRTEQEIFLRHFHQAIKAGAGAVMTAYDKYQGAMCGENKYLLTDVLKKQWGFDGFTLSDFVWGVKDTIKSALAGEDIEMPLTKYYGEALVKAVQDGLVPEEKIDDSAIRIVRTLLAYQPYLKHVDYEVAGSQAHQQLALKVAHESITLLKNNQQLPLKEDGQSILVLGKLAEADNLGDRGSSQVYPPRVVNILDGIRHVAGNNIQLNYYNGEDLNHSQQLAAKAAHVILVVGNDYNDEGEFVAQDAKDNYLGARGGDRKNGLGLHEHDVQLISKVSEVNSNSSVVLIGGSAITVNSWKDKVAAIIDAYYPGMLGGIAVADVLFGKVNPSGKLPFSIVKDEKDLPAIDWEATEQHYGYFNGYRLLDHKHHQADFPFGFGLSYTKFKFDQPLVWQDDQQIKVAVQLHNCGDRYGQEVIQVYAGAPDSKVMRAKKSLVAFAKVGLQPSEKRTFTLNIPLANLEWFNEDHNQFELEHCTYRFYVGSSSADDDLLTTDIKL